MYLPRSAAADLKQSLVEVPVTTLLGPRQCGKSTLARMVLDGDERALHLDLQRPSDRRRLEEPELFFGQNRHRLICIDEVQVGAALFPLIRAEVDAHRRPGRFLLLGSASQDLLRHSSESLAGRVRFIDLTPFQYTEVRGAGGPDVSWTRHWSRGGFPDAFLAPSDAHATRWREDFIRTFLDRDLGQLGVSLPPARMGRLWSMLAHYHGQSLNLSKLAGALGVSQPTVRRYVDALEQTFMVRTLPPLALNLKKRLVKRPKLYLRDSGLLHALLELEDLNHVLGHPLAGASYEGWCVEQLVAQLPRWRASYYRTASGNEVDLVMERGGRRLAFELKLSTAPKASRGLRESLSVLRPEETWIVAPVGESWRLEGDITVANLPDILTRLGDRGLGVGEAEGDRK